jgi:probable rRNA maturation factor
MGSIRFFSEKIRFKIPHPRKTTSWIKKSIAQEGLALSSLNIIFCTDEYLAEMNEQYLGHKTLTDILTFDHSGLDDTISGDIFISIPRIRENAVHFKTTFDLELHRVIIHGVLHLIGYGDKTARQKSRMREREDTYLSLRN